MRRTLRWLKRIVLGSLALAVVAVGVALIVLHTDWGRERIRRQIEAALADEFPGGARVGKLEGSVLGELVLTDVELAALDGAPLVSIGTLTVDVALTPLASNTIRVDRLVADRVTVVDPQRPFAPPPEPRTEGPGEPSAWTVELPDVELRDGTITLSRAATGGAPVTLTAIALQLAARLPSGAPITAAVTSLRGRWVERGLDFEASAQATLGDVPALARFDARLGGIVVGGKDIVLDLAHPAGTLTVQAPARAMAAIAPELSLPADAALQITASDSLVEITGNVGENRVTALVLASGELSALRGEAVIVATGGDLATVSQGAVAGAGTMLAVLRGDRAGVQGMLHATTQLAALPPVVATVAIDAAFARDGACAVPIERASGQLLVGGDGELRAGAIASVTGRDCTLVLADSARVAASVDDLPRATAGHVDTRGAVTASATITGTLSPEPALVVAATLAGRRLRQAELVVGHATGKLGATLASGVVTAKLDASASGVYRAGQPLGRAVAHAESRIDTRSEAAPRIAASATAWPAVGGAKRIDATATIELPDARRDTTRIELGHHALLLANGVRFQGRGGTIELGDRVTLRALRTASGTGSLEIDAGYDATGLEANVVAKTLPASLIDPAYRGSASGTIALRQRGLRWDGTAKLAARGLAISPEAQPLHGDLTVAIAGRRVSVDASAWTDQIGRVQLVLDVDGPRDLLDVAAWQRLERRSIKLASLAVDRVNLAAMEVPTGGIVDGKLYVVAGSAEANELRISNVVTPLGIASGTIVFSQQANDELGAAGSARVEGVGDANLTASFRFPDRPFDPLAWQRLGRGVARELVLVIDDVVVDPDRLAKLGFRNLPYHARADIQIGLHPGSSEAKLQVDLHDVHGGVLVKPLDLEIRASSDRAGTAAKVTLIDPAVAPRSGLAAAQTSLKHRDLIALDGTTPVTFDRWLTARLPDLIRSPLTGRLEIRRIAAKRLLAYFGRLQRVEGTVGGGFDLAGTLGVPTVKGELTAKDIAGPPGIEGGRPPKLDELKLALDWGGVAGRATLTGIEANGRLHVSAQGQPTRLETILANAKFTRFDLAPIAALLPGELAASTGILEGDISIHKLDPRTMKGLGGYLRLTSARIPLIPILGTLHDATAMVSYGERGLVAIVEGPKDTRIGRHVARLGQTGKVWMKVTGPRDLSRLDGRLEVYDVQMIGEIEPIVTGVAVAKLVRQNDRYVGRIDVSNASVIVPEETGEDLLDPDAPSDLYIVEDGVKLERQPMFVLGARAPDHPFLVVDINLQPTKIEALSILDDFGVRATAQGNLKVSLGDSLGVLGRIGIDRGTVDVLGRIYKIDPASQIVFDGTTDGLLGIELSHDFPSMTLFVNLGGRIATPDPQLDSDPRIYTQGQLAGFLAGGDPGGDTAQQTREAATGTGAALLSTRLGKRLKRVLPVKLDLIRCDPGSSAAGASCTIGRWLSDNLFLAFKSRLEARPDENSGDLQLQWYFRREWLIEGVGGDRNHNGIDLLWRRRW